MKKSILLFTSIACAFAMAACDTTPPKSKHNFSNQEKQDNSEAISYRFADAKAKCDTMQRTFESNNEMCFGLQVDSINNGCAVDQRKAFFQQSCEGMTWQTDQTIAERAMKETNGKYVECLLTENGEHPLTQFSSQFRMTMQNNNTRVLVKHGLKEGKIGLIMVVEDIATEKLLFQTSKVFVDQTEEVVLNDSGTPRLACKVTVTDDPRR